MGEELTELTEHEKIYDEDGNLPGYRYRLDKDGLWGYISRDFSQVLSPRFEDIQISFYALLAWGFQRETRNETEDEYYTLDVWYHSIEGEPSHGRLSSLTNGIRVSRKMSGFDGPSWPRWKGAPDESFKEQMKAANFEYALGDVLLSVGDQHYFLSRGAEGELNRLYFPEEKDGILRGVAPREVPAPEFNLFACLDALNTKVVYGRLKHLTEHYYAEKKDGLWGVFEYEGPDAGEEKHPEMLLPYAFTGIDFIEMYQGKPYLLMDRFGKKGVYCIQEERFISPCDYERIKFDEWTDRFIVRRMGFVGEINLDGKWTTRLHRENED